MAREEENCSICFELLAPGTAICLSHCQHMFCIECLEKWFLQEERASDKPPLCPYCRCQVMAEDVFKVLGREYNTLTTSNDVVVSGSSQDNDNGAEATEDGDGLDEFTRAYLEENGARQCPDCGAWIVLFDGCDNVMCRCGCRFCFCCGTRGSCEPGTFYNNVEEEEEEYEYEWDPDCESVAGPLVPLFRDPADDWEHEAWYDVWVPPTEEWEPADIVAIFDFRRDSPWFLTEVGEASQISPLFADV